jgi:hypothetical protein
MGGAGVTDRVATGAGGAREGAGTGAWLSAPDWLFAALGAVTTGLAGADFSAVCVPCAHP